MRQVAIVQMIFRQNQIHKATSCKIPKTSPRTYIRLSGLKFWGAYNRTFEFLNVKIKKRISQRVKSYYSYKLRLLHHLRDTNLSYLSEDKEDKK